MHEPKLPELVVLKSRLSPQVWGKRERAARKSEQLMKALADKIEGEGLSFNEAVRRVLPEEKRSWAVRRWRRWKRHGLDGLFDLRKPPGIRVTKTFKELVIGARLADPGLTVEKALKVLSTGGIRQLPSVSTVKCERPRESVENGAEPRRELLHGCRSGLRSSEVGLKS